MAKVKETIINPKFIRAMHENTSEDDHSVVLLKIKLTRTSKGYKEKVLGMHSFAGGLYEAFESFGVDVFAEEEKNVEN